MHQMILDPPENARRSQARRRAWFGALFGFPAFGMAWMVCVGPWMPIFQAGTFAAGVLVGLLGVCTVTDLTRKKIYNWATYPAFLWAVVVNVWVSIQTHWLDEVLVPPSLEVPADPTLLHRMGAVGILDCFLGASVCFFALLVIYQMAGFRGAGDVKLATAIGAWLGLYQGLAAILYTYVVAGVILISWFIATVGPGRVFGQLFRKLGAWLLPGLILSPEEPLPQLQRPVPMSAFFAAGTLLVLSGGTATMRLRRKATSVRRGMTALETVMITGVVVPAVALLTIGGMRVCRLLYQVVASLVCWPYL